jgi:hypothetical protein
MFNGQRSLTLGDLIVTAVEGATELTDDPKRALELAAGAVSRLLRRDQNPRVARAVSLCEQLGC